MLAGAGLVSELQLNAALAEQRRWGGRLGSILVRMGAIHEDTLVLALSRQLNVPAVDLLSIDAIHEALTQRIDRATCERYRVLPLVYVPDRRSVRIAMADPTDVVAVDDLQRRLGLRIEPLLAGEQALAQAIRRLYGAASPSSLAGAAELDLIDNAGRPRAFASSDARAAGLAATAPSSPSPPPPSSAPQPIDAQVQEHVRVVHAVRELLARRGLTLP